MPTSRLRLLGLYPGCKGIQAVSTEGAKLTSNTLVPVFLDLTLKPQQTAYHCLGQGKGAEEVGICDMQGI